MADKLFEEVSRALNEIGGAEDEIVLSKKPDYIIVDVTDGSVFEPLRNVKIAQGERADWIDTTGFDFNGSISLNGNVVTYGYYSGGAYMPTLTVKAYIVEQVTVWQEPVWNRTQADVDFALKKIKEWKENGGRTAYDLKGCLNVSDLNRIENNLKYLSEMMVQYRYSRGVSTRKWIGSDIPTESDIKRILGAVESLVQGFHKHENAPDIPSSLRTYEDLNAVEKNLYFIKMLMNIMEDCFKQSGTFQSGSKMYLPIRR